MSSRKPQSPIRVDQGLLPYSAINQAARARGHENRTAGAAVGGLIGAAVGSFVGPVGALIGGGLGGFIGASVGGERD